MSLRKKVLLLTTAGMVSILGLFSLVSILAVQRSTQNALMERLTFTQQQANILDFVLKEIREQTGSRLLANGMLLMNSGSGVRRELLEEWRKTMIVEPLYLSLLDDAGRVILSQPDSPSLAGTDKSSFRYIQQALDTLLPQTSDAYLDPAHNAPVAYIGFPIPGGPGRPRGILDLAFDPMSPDILRFIKPAAASETAHAEVVDSAGIVLSSTRPELVLQMSDHGSWLATQVKNRNSAVSACHSCHDPTPSGGMSNEVITFAPLATAPWGIVVRQDEDEVLAPSRRLQRDLAMLGFLSFFAVAFVAWVTTENVARPIRLLNKTSLRLATGDLSEPVPLVGGGEVATLAASFETMRNKLQDSLEELKQRSQQLERSEHLRTQLMRNLISSEEEKRKRIARDLHDETSQALTSLLVGLQAIAESPHMESDVLTARLNALQETAQRTLEEIHRVIYELRPSIIDDLGLLPAIKWYAESRLENAGIKLYLETAGQERRLSPEIEITLYRIMQEAITNIIKYSKAEICSITLDFQNKAVAVHIEDDGRGFDPGKIIATNSGQQHFGILGIKERVELLDGTLNIKSEAGKGTEIDINIPYGKETVAK
ncbi:MAG: HAMP domain-containing protein [Chloroflexi bacterium]|nr:HAMP domain-containing protein [Chloroflexota bacterium]